MEEDNNKKSKIKKGVSIYLQYTGIAFQMAGLIIVSIFLGKKLDAYFQLPKAYITGVLTLLTLTIYMYKLYLDLMKKEK